MKKLVLGLSVLLSGFAATSQASLPNGNTGPGCVTAPTYCGGLNFGITGLYWRADAPQQGFATTFDNISLDFPFTAFGDDGRDQKLHHKYSWGFQINLGYTLPCSGTDFELVYTDWSREYFRDVDHVQVTPTVAQLGTFDVVTTGPVVQLFSPGLGIVVSGGFIPLPVLINDPNFEFIDISSRVFGKTTLENHTWDLNVGQSINVGCNTRVHWYGGLRYSNLDGKFDRAQQTTFIGQGLPFVITAPGEIITTTGFPITGTTALFAGLGVIVTDYLHEKSKFDGIGPRFGLDIDYRVGCSGLGLVADISTSLLVGEIESSFSEDVTLAGQFTNVNTGTGLVVTVPGVGPVGVVIPPQTANFTSDTGPLSFTHPDQTRVVPNIDGKLGVDWSLQFCNCSRTQLRLEAGYMISHYFDAIDRSSPVGFGEPGFGRRQTFDLNFEGPYVSAQVKL